MGRRIVAPAKILAILTIIFCLIGTVKPSAIAADKWETVWRNSTGTTYHRKDCTLLADCVSISLGRAIDNGYTPCWKCNPPTLEDDGSQKTAIALPVMINDNVSSQMFMLLLGDAFGANVFFIAFFLLGLLIAGKKHKGQAEWPFYYIGTALQIFSNILMFRRTFYTVSQLYAAMLTAAVSFVGIVLGAVIIIRRSSAEKKARIKRFAKKTASTVVLLLLFAAFFYVVFWIIKGALWAGRRAMAISQTMVWVGLLLTGQYIASFVFAIIEFAANCVVAISQKIIKSNMGARYIAVGTFEFISSVIGLILILAEKIVGGDLVLLLSAYLMHALFSVLVIITGRSRAMEECAGEV